MKRAAYSKYKQSGVEWLGEVPEGWGISKIKYNSSVKARVGWQNLRSDEFSDEGPYCVTGTDFINGIVNWGTAYHVSEERYNVDPYIQLKQGDLLITKDGSIGKLALVDRLPQKACLNAGVFVVPPLKCDYSTRFLFWILSSKSFGGFIDLHSGGSTINHLYQNVFERFSFPLPDLETQTAIANFLDRETGQIDNLLAKKRALVGLLKEKRTTLISQTVTRGLTTDAAREFGLEPHLRFKDSGIEWLGEVPEEWEVCKLKRVTISRCDGPFGSGLKSEHYSDEGIRVIRLQNIRFAQFDDRDAVFIEPEHYRELGDHSVIPGDLLVAGLGDENHPVGRACVAPLTLGPAMVKADCFRFRLNSRQVHSPYIALQLSTIANTLAGALATGTTRGRMNLSARKIGKSPFPLSPNKSPSPPTSTAKPPK